MKLFWLNFSKPIIISYIVDDNDTDLGLCWQGGAATEQEVQLAAEDGLELIEHQGREDGRGVVLLVPLELVFVT